MFESIPPISNSTAAKKAKYDNASSLEWNQLPPLYSGERLGDIIRRLQKSLLKPGLFEVQVRRDNVLVDLLKETQKKGFDPFYKITVFTIILISVVFQVCFRLDLVCWRKGDRHWRCDERTMDFVWPGVDE